MNEEMMWCYFTYIEDPEFLKFCINQLKEYKSPISTRTHWEEFMYKYIL